MYNVLITDDEPLALEGLKIILNSKFKNQIRIYEANLGSETFNIVNDTHIDIAFMDINMEGLNGLDTISILKRKQKDIVFIILSGYSEFTYAQRAVELGILKYLSKPVNTSEIEETMNEAMKRIDNYRSKIDYKSNFNSLIEDNSKLLFHNLNNGYPTSNIIHILENYYNDLAIHKIDLENDADPKKEYCKIKNLINTTFDCIISPLYKKRFYVILTGDSNHNKGFNEYISSISRLSYCENLMASPIQDVYTDQKDKLTKLVLNYLNEKYNDSSITLKSVAEKFNVSASYLTEKLKTNTNYTFIQHLTRIRLKKAVELLENNYSVKEVANLVGFSDPNYFTRLYKRKYKTPPTKKV